jgi:hypothetical protein
MKKMGDIVAIIFAACLMVPFTHGGSSLAMAQDGTRLTAEQAIAAARRNSKTEKLGGTFSVLMQIHSNADTRRVGDKALEQAQAHKIELYQNGILADVLRSGGFLLLQTFPSTNKANGVDPLPFVSALHLVSLGRDGVPEDVLVGGGTNLADTQELLKNTTEFAEQLYSTPSTEESSLESRFYGGSFPEADQFQGTLFAMPHSLRKLGADPNEVRKAAALYGGYLFWAPRYALSMPFFAASPVAAENAAEDKRNTLKAEFLRSNHMDPDLSLDLDNVQSKVQLQERVELLTRLDRFLEDALKNEGDPAVVRANLSIATMSLGAGPTSGLGQGIYETSAPTMFEFFWQRLPAGGFAVKMISEAGCC